MRPDLDSRLRRSRPRLVDRGPLTLERIWCLSCCRTAGAVTPDLPPGVIYVCDACHDRLGALPLPRADSGAKGA